jgi:hypothetical protein
MNFFLSFLQVAISYNTISKKLSRNVQTSGLHLNAPGFKFIIFPSVFTSMEFDDISVCLFDLFDFWTSFSFSVLIEMVFRLILMLLYNFKLIRNIYMILFYNLKILRDIKKFFMQQVELLFMTHVHSKFDEWITFLKFSDFSFNTTAFQSMRGYFQVKLLEVSEVW